jgi:hypothetical protein
VRLLVRWLVAAIMATIALGLARLIAPGRTELALDIYVLLLGGMALLSLVSWLRDVAPEPKNYPLEEALGRHAANPDPIAELARLERELQLGATTAFDLHFRLRPVLREIGGTLLERHGLRLDSGDPEVRERLGDDLWEIVRPDREPPENRHAPGPGLVAMRRVVERLEAVS